jgi:MFS family permease
MEHSSPVPPHCRGIALVALCLAAFVISLDTTIVNVALPSLVRQLHASITGLQRVVDAYSLVFAALILASGSLSDRLGRKGTLIAGLGLFGAASAGDRGDAISRYMILSETAVRESGVRWTFLRHSGYMSNALHRVPQVRAGDVAHASFPGVRVAAIGLTISLRSAGSADSHPM